MGTETRAIATEAQAEAQYLSDFRGNFFTLELCGPIKWTSAPLFEGRLDTWSGWLAYPEPWLNVYSRYDQRDCQ